MKTFFIDFLSFFISYLICFVGLYMVVYFLANELSFTSFIVGLIGYMISFRPAVEEWKERVKNIFEKF